MKFLKRLRFHRDELLIEAAVVTFSTVAGAALGAITYSGLVGGDLPMSFRNCLIVSGLVAVFTSAPRVALILRRPLAELYARCSRSDELNHLGTVTLPLQISPEMRRLHQAMTDDGRQAV